MPRNKPGCCRLQRRYRGREPVRSAFMPKMAAHPVPSGQQPPPGVGPNNNSSSPPTSQSPQEYGRPGLTSSSPSITSPSSSQPPRPSYLSEEQLAKLPRVFREITHQQCLEMDGNLFIPLPEQRDARGPINVLLADHVNWVVSLVLPVLFLLGVGMVISMLLLAFGLFVCLPSYMVVCIFALIHQSSPF